MFSQIILVGYVGQDPTMRYTSSGTPITELSVATSRSYTDKAGAKVDETTWYRVSVFGNQAEACSQYLSKGKPVLVVGRLRPDPLTGGPRVFTRKDGSTGATFEVNAENVRFLPSGGKNDATPEYDDDITF